MSSRWISISLSGPGPDLARAALIAAWHAFTSDDLPMPRAPQSSALLAGRPLAKRSVLSISTSRTRSIPRSRDMSTRLTLGTGTRRRPSGCQTKASATPRSGAAGTRGLRRSSASAMRRSVSVRSSAAGVLASIHNVPDQVAGGLAHGGFAPQGRRRIGPNPLRHDGFPRIVAIGASAAIVRADFDGRPDS